MFAQCAEGFRATRLRLRARQQQWTGSTQSKYGNLAPNSYPHVSRDSCQSLSRQSSRFLRQYTTHQELVDSERVTCFELFHENSLKFEGYLLSRTQMPAAKESDSNCNVEIRMFDRTQSSAQRVRPQKAGP